MKYQSSIFLVISLLVMIGCGYKPSNYYVKNTINGDVYVDVKMDVENSKNSILIKDAMNKMVINQFDAILTNNRINADIIMIATLSKVSNKAISSDNEGYARTYRTTVNILLSYQKTKKHPKYIKKKNPKITISVSNYYDYIVDADAILTDQKKEEAINIAIDKALSDIFSKIAISTFKESK